MVVHSSIIDFPPLPLDLETFWYLVLLKMVHQFKLFQKISKFVLESIIKVDDTLSLQWENINQ